MAAHNFTKASKILSIVVLFHTEEKTFSETLFQNDGNNAAIEFSTLSALKDILFQFNVIVFKITILL